MKMRIAIAGLLSAAAVGFGLTACGSGGLGGEGSFVGPPQGSSFGGRVTPLIGASPFTFEPEVEQVTGFAVDHWYINPGADTNESFTGGNIPIADGINALADSDFEQFVCGNCTSQNPQFTEINFQFPISISFMTQWFGRNADNTRPTTIDVFGRVQYSDAALDVSIITGPVVEGRDMAGNLISITIDGNYPNRDLPGGAVQLPLKGWNAPPAGDPFSFPPSQQSFSSNQFNIIGLIRVKDVSSGVANGGGQQGGIGGAAALSIGAAIQDMPDNGNVETMLSIPARNMAGQAIAVQLPVGVFSDNYALVYITSPVKQAPQGDPTAIPPVPPSSLSDPEMEEALIEYSRHMASVCTNILGQAVGLGASNADTIMDPRMAIFQNGYEYRFGPTDINQLATVSLPGARR